MDGLILNYMTLRGAAHDGAQLQREKGKKAGVFVLGLQAGGWMGGGMSNH